MQPNKNQNDNLLVYYNKDPAIEKLDQMNHSELFLFSQDTNIKGGKS